MIHTAHTPFPKSVFTSHDSHQGIFNGYCYQRTDTNGNQFIEMSIDLLDGKCLERIEDAETLVDKIVHSKAVPFEINRTLQTVDVQSTSSLADDFYKVVGKVAPCWQPHKLEFGEHVNVFNKAMSDLNLTGMHFTNNPAYQHGINANITEAEIINNVINQIRAVSNRLSSKTKIKKRKDQMVKHSASAKRLVERLLDVHGNIHVFRIECEYKAGTAVGMTLDQAVSYNDQFQNELVSNPLFQSVVGFIWKRSYLSEIGYRQHYFLFVEPNHLQIEMTLLTQITMLWESVTQGTGQCIDARSYGETYKKMGVGNIGFFNKQYLLDAIQFWLKMDFYLRLQPNKHHDHFGLSQLPPKPKLVNTPGIPLMPQYREYVGFPNGFNHAAI